LEEVAGLDSSGLEEVAGFDSSGLEEVAGLVDSGLEEVAGFDSSGLEDVAGFVAVLKVEGEDLGGTLEVLGGRGGTGVYVLPGVQSKSILWKPISQLSFFSLPELPLK